MAIAARSAIIGNGAKVLYAGQQTGNVQVIKLILHNLAYCGELLLM